MDRFENGLSKEDILDSWDIINNDCEEDTQDFEIIKVLREFDVPSGESTSCDTVVKKSHKKKNNNKALRKDTFTTDDSGETTDEAYDYEDTKKSKQGIKNDQNNFVEALANKLTTKKELKFKRKQSLPEKTISMKKDENKNQIKKCMNKKSRPLLNSANLGALLTAFGLSLIFLNTSDKTPSCTSEQQSKNVSETLADAINETKIWTDGADSMLDEEHLLERFLPAYLNKTISEKKNLKTKLLKRIDRKIKQQIRGCDIKPIKKEKKITSEQTPNTTKQVGPLMKNDEFYANNSSTTSSKPSYRDAVLSNKSNDKESVNSNITLDNNVSKTKADMMNKFLDADAKNFKQTSCDLEITNKETKHKVSNNEGKKKPNCCSIYRDFIKAEILFKKILNNSYDIPKPKTPTDLAFNIENKINALTEDNINLSNIIEEQEKILRQIQDKIEYKKETLQKRSQQKNILQKRLKFANWMKQKREQHDDQNPKAPKVDLGVKILNDIVMKNVKTPKPEENTSSANNTSTSKSSTELAPRYDFECSVYEEKYKNKSEEETAIYVKRKLNLLKKQEDLQRNMIEKKRKLIDEEQTMANRLPEKSDPKRAWAKKKTEF